MLINEVTKITNLTKKAIAYYSEQGLISPSVLENGYRDFSTSDVDCFKKISILRKLGIGTDEIRLVLLDKTGEVLQRLSIKRELSVQRASARKAILDKLSCGASYMEIGTDLKAIEDSTTITEKLLEAFPGYYGRFVCLHFARFLNEPIETDKQKTAYQKIIAFLDDTPTLNLPMDLQDFLIESTSHLGVEQITEIIESTKKSIEHPEDFISENKETLDWYLAFIQSDEYRNSPAYKMKTILKEFNSTSGYYDIFIPALKELSSSYAEYYKQLDIANDKFISQYPEIEKLNDLN